MSSSHAWKHVWITGAGRGIGAALAELLAKQGTTVSVSARSTGELEQLRQRCESFKGKIVPAPLDITNQDEIRALTQQWQQQDNWPDLVVLNAGTHDPFPANEFSAERCEKLWQVNLIGTSKCLEPVVQHMLQQGRGQIAVMASSAGYQGLPTAAAYGAGKAALINMCECLYPELKQQGVKLQVINPGFVRTPLTDKNPFEMPALMEVDDAAQALLKGLQKNQFEIVFPKRFVWILKLLKLLPYSLYFKLVAKITL